LPRGYLPAIVLSSGKYEYEDRNFDETATNHDVALSLRDLTSFVAVARAGGVTRAARELGYAQATLSAHLAALQSAIGVPLIEPERRGAPLTEAGRTVARAKALLRDAAALHRAALFLPAAAVVMTLQ